MQQKDRKWLNNKARVGKQNDKRVKISEEDKKDILRLFNQERLAIREIARIYQKKCSRRSIQFIIYPERGERVKARAKEVKRWQAYNTKEYHTPAMRKYRQHLREIYKIEK